MKHASYGSEDFLRDTSVSRETLERLEAYANLLRTWNKTTNLVGAATLPDLWRRHVLDSAQLLPFLEHCDGVADVGTGAGFPGLVLAIMGLKGVRLIEADSRKVAFLREAARIAGAQVEILPTRAETLRGLPVTHITARAFAPTSEILEGTFQLAKNDPVYVLLKGQNVDEELTQTHKMWSMEAESHPSRTDPRGRIIILRGVRHV